MENKQKPKMDKIQWIGIDGILVVAWFVIVILILIAFVKHIDFLIQWFFPALLFATTTAIFIDYCTKVGGFIKLSRSNADKRKSKMQELEELEKETKEEE